MPIEDHAKNFTSQRPVETNLSDDRTINQIRGWLDECLTTHNESLSQDGQTSVHRVPLPTRVIDVGTESQPACKLFQSSSILYENYVTLSYCWGRQRFLTLLSSNIQTHFEGLEELKLPQTFIDASTLR